MREAPCLSLVSQLGGRLHVMIQFDGVIGSVESFSGRRLITLELTIKEVPGT